MWWIILIVCLLLICSYLLFAPFFLEIDSGENLVRVRFHRVVSGKLVFTENSIFMILKIAGWQKQIDLLAVRQKKKKKAVKKAKAKRKIISFKRIYIIMKSFR